MVLKKQTKFLGIDFHSICPGPTPVEVLEIREDCRTREKRPPQKNPEPIKDQVQGDQRLCASRSIRGDSGPIFPRNVRNAPNRVISASNSPETVLIRFDV